jgi:sulfur relay (sulfurtransferase) DsrF/TusC family protein
MKDSLCLLIRRPPYGQIHAAEAIRHVGGALAEGLQTSVVLIDDGVYFAREGQNMGDTAWTPLAPALLKVLVRGARVFVHTPSAQTRGLLQDEHFLVGIKAIDDEGVARVLAASDAVMVY